MGCNQSTTGATVNGPEGLSWTRRLSERSINSTAAGGATTLHSPSFNSLRTAASTFFDINLDASGNISQLKHEISSKPDLVHFIQEYFKSNIYTLNFFTAVKDPLQKIREAEPLIRDAVILFEEGSDPQAVLKKLQKFKEEVNRFKEKFIQEFMMVVELQNSTLRGLNLCKRKLGRKLRRIKAWRKVWNIIYSAVFGAVLICAVVLAAVAAPPAAAAAAAAASGAMAPLQQWVGSIWDQLQSPYEGEKDVIDLLKKSTKLAIHELNNIKALVEELEIKIGSIIHSADLAIEEKEEAALKVAMDEIKPKAGSLAKSVEDLEIKEVDRRVAELKTAIAVILKAVTD